MEMSPKAIVSKKPIETMLDRVDWKSLPVLGATSRGDVPHATHEGVLDLGGFLLRVYQLSDGNRVIEEKDLVSFFEELSVDAPAPTEGK